jgi:hypothetical protein
MPRRRIEPAREARVVFRLASGISSGSSRWSGAGLERAASSPIQAGASAMPPSIGVTHA